MNKQVLNIVWIVTAALLLSACASTPKTDLKRLYGMQSANPDQPPVVVIHGTLGGELADSATGKEVWPGSLGSIAFSDYRNLKLEIDPNTLEPLPSTLVTSGIARSAVGVDFYGRILSTLEDVAGYQLSEPGKPAAAGVKRYYVFSYDWRQDNVATVRALDEFIASIQEDYGDPNLKVDIVAHSMG